MNGSERMAPLQEVYSFQREKDIYHLAGNLISPEGSVLLKFGPRKML